MSSSADLPRGAPVHEVTFQFTIRLNKPTPGAVGCVIDAVGPLAEAILRPITTAVNDALGPAEVHHTAYSWQHGVVPTGGGAPAGVPGGVTGGATTIASITPEQGYTTVSTNLSKLCPPRTPGAPRRKGLEEMLQKGKGPREKLLQSGYGSAYKGTDMAPRSKGKS